LAIYRSVLQYKELHSSKVDNTEIHHDYRQGRYYIERIIVHRETNTVYITITILTYCSQHSKQDCFRHCPKFSKTATTKQC